MNEFMLSYRDWDEYLACFTVDGAEAGGVASKPLLLLHLFSSAMLGRPNLFAFNEVEPTIRDGLARFGGSTGAAAGVHVAYWELAAEGCWSVIDQGALAPGRYKGRPTLRTFREKNVRAAVSARLWGQLADPKTARRYFEKVLARCFNEPVRSEACSFFGLSDDGPA
jgi:hypothetical protein